MDIEKIKEFKRSLEDNIMKSIRTFEEETGINVYSIAVVRHNVIGRETEKIVDIEIEIKL